MKIINICRKVKYLDYYLCNYFTLEIVMSGLSIKKSQLNIDELDRMFVGRINYINNN
jgi:hypothetical protein